MPQLVIASDLDSSEKILFNIPQQRADQALIEFAEQADMTFIFSFDEAQRLTVNNLLGRYTRREALQILLGDTGLTPQQQTDGVLVIRSSNNEEDRVMKNYKKNLLASLIGIFSATGAVADNASNEGSEEFLLEEIIVTAQKREQVLEDVPMAISAVSNEQIQNLGVVGLDELQSTVPGLTVSKLGQRETITLRSIAPPGATLPTVGRYLDEMGLNSQTAGDAVDIPLVDLSRIEVLKGPQGTLYGEGSIGGTIKYITQAPRFGETDGIFEVTARSTEYGDFGYRTQIAGNLPIDSETFGVRLTAFYDDEPGWIDSSVLGDDANDQQRWFARIRADWEPSDTFRAEFLYQTYDSELGVTPSSNSPDGFESDAYVTEPNEADYDLYSLKLNFDLGWADLTSVSSYQDRFSQLTSDVTGQLPGSGTRFSWTYANEITSFTQELRLNGEAGDNLFWTGGLFYRDIESELSSLSTREGAIDPFLALVLDAPLGFELFPADAFFPGSEAVVGAGLDSSQPYLAGGSVATTEAKAIFAEVNYLFTDDFEVTLGARYYEDERETASIFTSFGESLANSQDVDNDSTVLRLVVKYRFDEDLMMYASASEGFRSGGAQSFSAPGLPTTYEPEELMTYEIGSKGSLAGGLIKFDAALFFTEYENIQVYLPNDFNAQLFGNIGKAEVLGAELSTQLFATDDLFFQINAAYNDSEYKEPGLTHDAGDPMDGVPKYTYSVSGDYSFSWASEVDGHFRVDYFFRDETQTSLRGIVAAGANDFTTTERNKQLNIRLGATFDKHSVYLFAENVLNHRAVLGEPSSSTLEWQLQKPRVVGVTFRTSF